jgi:hypothetical protein
MSYILNQIQFNIWYDKKITARKLHTVFLKYLNHVIFLELKFIHIDTFVIISRVREDKC